MAEIGSTTTVVSGFSGLNGNPRLVGQGQGPTTVTDGDVRIGLEQALADLQLSLVTDELEWEHIYACSSAAGGLKMTVHGLVYDMTAKAAREAALGAGAVIHQVTAGSISDLDLKRIVEISPNIILLAGGVDYGEGQVILSNARKLANLGLPIPLIYAGNVAIQEEIREIFSNTPFSLTVVENVYPHIDDLNIEPTRQAIQQAFEEHIIHAPGMSRIRELVDGPIQPVPGAVLSAAVTLFGCLGDLLVFDVGGATTDLHSVTPGSDEINSILLSPEPLAKRTVEGDLGVYINAANLMKLDQGPSVCGQERCGQGLVVPIPKTEAEIAFAESLAARAISQALERHSGRIHHVYGPGGRQRIARGKDLTRIKYIVGTGGALTRLPRGKELLAGNIHLRDPAFLGPPATATVLIDRHYVMAAAGVLTSSHPESAVALMLDSLDLEGLDVSQADN